MKISQGNIHRLLQSAADRGLTVKEMLIAMEQKKSRKAALKKILKLLSRQKVCYKRNNRYYLSDQAEKSPRPGKKNAISKSYGTQKKSRKNEFLGIVFCRGRSFSVFSFDHETELKIGNSNVRDFLHGDLVRFSLGMKRTNAVTVLEIVERRIRQLKGKVYPGKKGKQVFIPNGNHGIDEFRVANIQTLDSQEGVPAWLEVNQGVRNKKHLQGNVRLIKNEDPYQHSVVETILITNKIPGTFSQKVREACSHLSKTVRLKKADSRVDLRVYPFVTVDGEDAKDFDDAIYAEKEGENYRIWVSIADVDEYVPQGSVLDKEAFCRGTSTYLPGKVFPMLPNELSNGVCSLKEGVNRKTLTCECLIDRKGKTLEVKVYTSINRIFCRLTYTLLDRYFATGQLTARKRFSDLTPHLDLYREIMNVLRNKRIQEGYINFHLPESQFKYDKTGRVVGVIKNYQTEANQVIEQFMLLANENIARYCDRNRIPIVWRNHPQPLPEKRKQLHNLFWNSNIKLPAIQSSKDFNIALGRIRNRLEKDFLEYSMLRSMSLAVYEVERKGHFGISTTHYCHFTSPIRRFPDLLVHRAIKRHLQGEKPLKIPEYIAAAASERERLATAAERMCSKFFKLDIMSERIGEIFEAKVIGFIHSGIFVEIASPFVEGFVPFQTIRDDHYEYDEENQCIWGKGQKRRLRIGTTLKVMLTSLDMRNLSSEFDWICWREKV